MRTKPLMFLISLAVIAGSSACTKKAAPAAAPAERKILYYRNPMQPSITSPVPMKDSMGMDYVAVYEDEVQGSGVPGQAMVQMSAAREQSIGVRVSRVERRDMEEPVRASARVAYDPGLYSAIVEHQEAVAGVHKERASSEMKTEAESTVRASTLRLRQMGLSEDQIEKAGNPGFDPSNLLLGRAGGKVWVYADLYDYESALVKPGQRAELTSQAFPGLTFKGIVRAVDSVINAETRTLRARIETPNPDGDLKPEMYMSAVIHASIGRGLAIPESALMDTGTRQLVFVQKEPGHYEPRQVKVGRLAGSYYEVLSGLQEGETVVTSANFLLDSESKLKAAAEGQ